MVDRNDDKYDEYLRTVKELENMDTESAVLACLALNDEAFTAVCDFELRGRPRLRKMLRDVKLRERWWLALVEMKRTVENQLGARSDDITRLLVDIDSPGLTDTETSDGLTLEQARQRRRERHHRENQAFLAWRGGTKRFEMRIEERLFEVKRLRLREAAGNEVGADQLNSALFLQRTLVSAIMQHKQRVLAEFDVEVSEADTELWSLIDRISA